MGAIFGKRPNSARAKQQPQPQSKVTENDRVVLVSARLPAISVDSVCRDFFV